MKTTIITEFVNFKMLETTNDDQLIKIAEELINGFLKKQDGFMDAEMVKNISENVWCFIIHYQSMENIKTIVEKMRNSKEFEEFKLLIVPGSIGATFNMQLTKW
jgi:hypothetical protein